ncbi:SctK family type III secretion system sorting platform protein [Pseudomonas entomophila]|uniref:SctK family type III secretion system sorting platform protein n=1 Tax=Pseudomonas entomophila TaxID=312306 RepID=UPI001F00161C|nr:SctK family type III secretion system sorting platform protein [Pseudomonas entomophila]MCG8291429.1 Yop proteins translocation protein K [Pseudomonas entomophila]
MDEALTPYQLRYCPAAYLHPTRVPPALQALARAMPGWRGMGSVNAWLLHELDLPLDYSLPDQLGGLALFPTQQLQGTLAMLGALLHARAMRQAIDACTLRRVHAAIGAQGHRYCLERHGLLIGAWPQAWQLPLPPGDLHSYLPALGLAFLAQAIGDMDPGFTRRLQLRLEPAPELAACPVAEEQRPLARLLCLKIARHTSPTCLHLLD